MYLWFILIFNVELCFLIFRSDSASVAKNDDVDADDVEGMLEGSDIKCLSIVDMNLMDV